MFGNYASSHSAEQAEIKLPQMWQISFPFRTDIPLLRRDPSLGRVARFPHVDPLYFILRHLKSHGSLTCVFM